MIEIIKNKKVLEADDLDTDAVQIELALMIVLLCRVIAMNLAVEFDPKVFFYAIEVDDIASNAVLPTKLTSGQV